MDAFLQMNPMDSQASVFNLKTTTHCIFCQDDMHGYGRPPACIPAA